MAETRREIVGRGNGRKTGEAGHGSPYLSSDRVAPTRLCALEPHQSAATAIASDLIAVSLKRRVDSAIRDHGIGKTNDRIPPGHLGLLRCWRYQAQRVGARHARNAVAGLRQRHFVDAASTKVAPVARNRPGWSRRPTLDYHHHQPRCQRRTRCHCRKSSAPVHHG
jgi:hypothetical protein